MSQLANDQYLNEGVRYYISEQGFIECVAKIINTSSNDYDDFIICTSIIERFAKQ